MPAKSRQPPTAPATAPMSTVLLPPGLLESLVFGELFPLLLVFPFVLLFPLPWAEEVEPKI